MPLARRKRSVGGLAFSAGVEANTSFGPVLSDFATGQQEILRYSNDYSALSSYPPSAGALITSDGRYFIFGVNGGARVYDTWNDTFVSLAVPPGSSVTDIAQSKADGTIAMTTTGAPFLFLYSYPDFTYIPGPSAINPPPSTAYSCNFSDDGTKLCIGHMTLPLVMVYNTSTWADIVPTLSDTPTSATIPQGAAMSPDGNYIAIGGGATGNRSRVWNLNTGARLYLETSTPVGVPCFTPDSSKVLWQISNSTTIREVTLPGGTLRSITIPGVSGMGSSSTFRKLQFDNEGKLLMSCHRGVTFLFDYENEVLLSQVPNENNSSAPSAALDPRTQKRRISGVVTDDLGAPAERTIFVHDMASGRLLGVTTSNGTTGAYSVIILSAQPVYVIAEGSSGEQHKILSNVIPVAP